MSVLEAICKLLRSLKISNNPSSELNDEGKDALIELIRNVYGDHAADSVSELFFVSHYCNGKLHNCYDEVEDALRISLQGRG